MSFTIIFNFFFSMPPQKRKAHIQTSLSHTSQFFLQALNDYRAGMLKHTKQKKKAQYISLVAKEKQTKENK